MSLATGIRLDLRQTQSLVLTPQLQQAIRLLHKAERACLVSASLMIPVRVEPALVREAVLV